MVHDTAYGKTSVGKNFRALSGKMAIHGKTFAVAFLNQECQLVHAWFLKIVFVWTSVCVCLCVRVRPKGY